MKDFIDAVNSRIKTPYLGYTLLAFIALNWRGLFLLATTDGLPQDRLAAFDCATSNWTLVICPLLVGIFIALSTPWIQYFFNLFSKKPSGLIDKLSIEAEHQRTTHQARLEQSRAALSAVQEKELIDRAKRDEEVADIENPEAKEKLTYQLDQLRKERDELSAKLRNRPSSRNTKSVQNLSPEAITLIKEAAKDKQGIIFKSTTLAESSISIGGKKFGTKGQRDYANWDAALKELLTNRLVTAKGTGFSLTQKGWEVADSLV